MGLDPTVLTSLRVDAWRDTIHTTKYADKQPERVTELLDGLTYGMSIGFTGERKINRKCRNLSSATDNPEVEAKVHKLIMANVADNKTAGPFTSQPFTHFTVSPIGAVPKKAPPGEAQLATMIRVIHHLSHPFGGDSINASSEDVPLKLGSIDAAINLIVKLGRGCFLTKLDVKAAYKLVPVRAEDWPLLGFMWRRMYYYERTLPFGLKASCRHWEVYATALHHFFETEVRVGGVVHYVDDFLLVEQLIQLAQQQLTDARALCARLGIPLSEDKTEGPVTRLVFLGILLDTIAMTASLSALKLAEIAQLLHIWQGKTSADVRELQSLTGVLNWACKVVRPGRSYLRRIIDHTTSLADHHTQHPIPRTVQLDIEWWADFMPEWNGVSLLYELEWRNAPDINIETDACTTGYGARFGRHWIAGVWTPDQLKAAQTPKGISMPYLELLALTLGVATWAHLWTRLMITFVSDCMPVVHAIGGRSSKSKRMMELIRSLHLIAARHGFDFRCTHLAGVLNISADALSRGEHQTFRDANPDADQQQYPLGIIPQSGARVRRL
jgi:hypothetical protein